MRCPNCGAETWGQGGVCDYCGATLTGQPGRASGGAGRPEAPQGGPQGGWRQVPPAPPDRRAPRQDAPPGHERRPSTLGDLFGPSAPQGADRGDAYGDAGPAMPRFGPVAGPPTPRHGAPMAGPPTPRSAGKWRVSPEDDGRSPFSRPNAPPQDAAPRGFAAPDAPPAPDANSRNRWSAGPLQQFRRQVRDEQEQEHQPSAPPRRRPVDTAKRLGRRLGLSRGARAEAPPATRVGRDWEEPEPAARRGPPTPRPPDFGQAWQAPQPGAGWDFGAARQAPVDGRAAPATSQPLGRAWPGAATDVPWQPDDIPDEIESDYHDTGRGWSIAMPPLPDEQPAFMRMMTGGPRRTGGLALGGVGVALLGRLGRYTFNLTLLAVILAILAIPVSMGLARLGSLHPPIKPSVAAAKTPQPVPTPYAGYQAYQSALFSISYPGKWSHVTTSHSVNPGGSEQETEFVSPDKTMLFAVGTFAAIPSDQSEFTLQAVAHAFPGGATANYTALSAPGADAKLNGQPAIKLDFSCDYLVTAEHLVTLQGTAILRSQGLTTYVVLYVAPHDQLSSAQEQFITPMLDSLRLDA